MSNPLSGWWFHLLTQSRLENRVGGEKRNERQRRKGKIFPFESRVPENSKER